VLTAGGALVSASVVGNALESTGSAGSVYLRRVDTTLFSSNRCESPQQVNVVVIRAGDALVSVTGNTLAGREPPTPSKPPTPKAEGGVKGDASLVLGLGDGLSFPRKLDSAMLAQLLDERRDRDFSAAAQRAEVEVERFRAAEAGIRRSRAAPAAAPVEEDAARERALDAAAVAAVEASEMGDGAKALALYLAAGFSPDRARAELQSALARSGGDTALAYQKSKAALGVAAAAAPAMRVASSHLLEHVLLDAIDRPDIVVSVPPKASAPPDPRTFSLVIVGGARVTALGNATTAGVHVHDAPQSVENNV
jgi:hypothetical protein